MDALHIRAGSHFCSSRERLCKRWTLSVLLPSLTSSTPDSGTISQRMASCSGQRVIRQACMLRKHITQARFSKKLGLWYERFAGSATLPGTEQAPAETGESFGQKLDVKKPQSIRICTPLSVPSLEILSSGLQTGASLGLRLLQSY